jgi:CMP-N,N'-diacetyllegionaminic acid synthase
MERKQEKLYRDNIMKIFSMIPARGGSKGIPKKALYPLKGFPLIHYVIEASKGSLVDETWVSTDDNEIKEYCLNQDIYVLDRPSYLADDNADIEDVMLHFVKNVECDVIVMIQPTSPMLQSKYIDRGIRLFDSGIYSSVMSIAAADDILIWNTHWRHAINYDPYKRGRRQERINTFAIETGGFYIIGKEDLIRIKCRLTGNIGFIEIPFWKSFEVDSLEDLQNIEKLMS